MRNPWSPCQWMRHRCLSDSMSHDPGFGQNAFTVGSINSFEGWGVPRADYRREVAVSSAFTVCVPCFCRSRKRTILWVWLERQFRCSALRREREAEAQGGN